MSAPLEEGEVRVTLEFHDKEYSTVLDGADYFTEEFAKEVGKLVERTIRRHYGFEPTLDEVSR